MFNAVPLKAITLEAGVPGRVGVLGEDGLVGVSAGPGAVTDHEPPQPQQHPPDRFES